MSRKKSFSSLSASSPPSEAEAARLAAAAKLELARAIHHLRAARGRKTIKKTEVKGMTHSHISIGADTGADTDLPSELSSYADGVSDDAAYHPEIIGCSSGAVQGLGDLAVGGLPGYLFTRKSLANPAVRARVAKAIGAMTPKLRRRVVARLKLALSVARKPAAVSGISGIAAVTPTIGWSGVSIARCPYASVAGALTP